MLAPTDTYFPDNLHSLQGAELEVLKTVNLTQVDISVLVVELDGSNPEKDEAVRTLLLANDFELDTSMKGVKAGQRNEWFVSKNYSPPGMCSLQIGCVHCSHDKALIIDVLEDIQHILVLYVLYYSLSKSGCCLCC